MNDVVTPVPWFHEHGYGQLWNEWTWTHVAWGMISYKLTGGYFIGLVVHTVYELVEEKIFPDANRDISMTNHVGDTIAFLAGSRLAQYVETRK